MLIGRDGLEQRSRSSLDLGEVAADLALATNSVDVANALNACIFRHGFTSIVSLILPEAGCEPSGGVMLDTRPQEWLDGYLRAEHYVHDPVITEVYRRGEAFSWSDVVNDRLLDPNEQAVMDFADLHGMRDGLVVPFFSSGQQAGMIAVFGPRPEINSRTRSLLTLVLTAGHNRLCQLQRNLISQSVPLTSRELEVLRWIATGKPDWQIGQIMDISAKTVNYHVENVKRKFGVSTRIQAVVAALRQG